MAVHVKHQSRTQERTADGLTNSLIYEGTQEEIQSFGAEHPVNSYDPDLGRLVSAVTQQGDGPLWQCELRYQADFSGDTPTSPASDWEKKNARMQTGRIMLPLSKCPAYRAKWDHYLVRANTSAVPWNDWEEAETTEIPDGYGDEFRWISDLTELPSTDGVVWEVFSNPTKPGVQGWDMMTYTVVESAKFRRADKAGAMVRNKLNRLGVPDEDFGLGGEWKCDDATVDWRGKYWVATLSWTRGGDDVGWDDDMYEVVSDGKRPPSKAEIELAKLFQKRWS